MTDRLDRVTVALSVGATTPLADRVTKGSVCCSRARTGALVVENFEAISSELLELPK
jgi:hypothetical protein